MSTKNYNFLMEPATDAIADRLATTMQVRVKDVYTIEEAIERLRQKYKRNEWLIIQISDGLPVVS